MSLSGRGRAVMKIGRPGGRDPARDRDREIKGANWPTVAYRLSRLPAPVLSNRAQISSTSAP
jgi:hypothetical protein